MRKFFTTVLLILVTINCLSHDFEYYHLLYGSMYYNIVSGIDKTAAVTYKGASYSYYKNEYSGEVTIPSTETYNRITYTIVGIGKDAFRECSELTSVYIPKTVKEIGKGIFMDCSKLSSIKLESGNSVYNSRDNCNAIIENSSNTLIAGCKNTTIPNSVKTIGEYSFYGCTGLTTISTPESVTNIGDYAFYGCSGLTSVTIGNSVTDIGESAFCYCTSLNSLTIGNSVKTIGSYAFAILDIKSVTIPKSVTTIGWHAFWACPNLTSVYCYATIPPTIMYENAFSNVENCTLYVPIGCKSKYEEADYWKEFKEIVEVGDPTKVTAVNMSNSIGSVESYQINGIQNNGLQKGMNIIKTKDGVKKIIVK